MSLEKEFIPHTEALELKELGFDEPGFGYYLCKNSALGIHLEITSEYFSLLPYDSSSCKAPTFSQTFRWFREKYNQHCFIHYHSKPEYTFALFNDIKMYWTLNEKISFNTYEEAELACLKKLIEIVKLIK